MRIQNLLVFLLPCMITACSPKFDVVRKEAYTMGVLPPNCVWLKDSLYMDETEISNLHYREYLYWLARTYGQQSLQHIKALPDTLVWANLNPPADPLEEYYLRYPSYQDYPVVGITREQAANFCQWRSYTVNQMIFTKQNTVQDINFFADTTFNFPVIFLYRLPGKYEWEYAARAGIQSKIGYESIATRNGELKINTKEAANIRSYKPEQIFIGEGGRQKYIYSSSYSLPIYSGTQNKYALYNMIGNVAEIISDDSIAKGGSFYHYLDSCEISTDIPYTQPQAWLGFRCVCEQVNSRRDLRAGDLLKFTYTNKNVFDTTGILFSVLPIHPDTEGKKYDIRISDFKKVQKISDIIFINPDDTVSGCEAVFFTPNKVSLVSDYFLTDTLSPLIKTFIEDLEPNSTFIIPGLSVNGKQPESILPATIFIKIY